MYFVEMKTIIKLASLLPIFLVFVFQTGLTSCKKDPLNSDTVTIIKHDTVVVNPPTLLPEQVLTSSVWIIDEIRFLENNTLYYYKRDATSGNTANFDTETIKFNANKTGTYVAGGITYNVAWDFVNNDKSRISYTVSYSPTLTVKWENVTYTDSTIKYTEYYNRNGTYTMGYATRKKQ
jgi:hypothetical protein